MFIRCNCHSRKDIEGVCKDFQMVGIQIDGMAELRGLKLLAENLC